LLAKGGYDYATPDRARARGGARRSRGGVRALDGAEIAARLVAGRTDAVAGVLGERARGGTSVELVATPPGRTGQGGVISD
jgi:hypothetical protein